MRYERLRLFAMAPLAAGVLLAGCGSDDGGDGNSSDAPKSLQERLFSSGQVDFAKQQQLIRECMTAQGFEYTPTDNRVSNGNRVTIDPNSEDFVKENGFGISTMFASSIEISSSGSGDPNQEYRESLDDTQRAAYDKALYGSTITTLDSAGGSSGGGVIVSGPVFSVAPGGGGNSGGPVTTGGPANDGCFGKAIAETSGDAPTFDADLFDDLRDLEDRIDADPEMVEAMKKWSSCMAKAGYTYRDRNQAMDEIREEFGDLTGLEFSGDGGGFSVTISSSAEAGGTPGAFDPFANVDKAKLSALQEKEKRIALASFECSQEHVADTEAKVRERLENDFIDSHPELKDKATP